MMRRVFVAVFAVLLALGTVGCANAADQTAGDKVAGLTAAQQRAVTTDPDATTKALQAAGYRPFGLRVVLPEGNGYTSVIFGLAGSQTEDGHGTMERPWVLRELKKHVDERAESYREFRDSTLVVSGDNWEERKSLPRPPDANAPRYQCVSVDTVTADSLRQLPGHMMSLRAGEDLEPLVGGTRWSCWKRDT